MESREEEQEIAALQLVHNIAAMSRYDEMFCDGSDAIQMVNRLIKEARKITGAPQFERRHEDEIWRDGEFFLSLQTSGINSVQQALIVDHVVRLLNEEPPQVSGDECRADRGC